MAGEANENDEVVMSGNPGTNKLDLCKKLYRALRVAQRHMPSEHSAEHGSDEWLDRKMANQAVSEALREAGMLLGEGKR
ncbi:hypothetical protein [Halorhodospira halophila]|uniref:hypothetical protein n=1 Tax=Halorhodospira halophila TaxID=1053 RepID=UPI00191296BE|nr:hypothetical protein [Halorhodospira halophila]